MHTVYSDGTLRVWAHYVDGMLGLDGQDLGGHPYFDEYEYFIRVRPEDFPKLRQALGGDPADDVLDLIIERGKGVVQAGETAWLKSHGIPFTISTWP